ncbi:MAG: ATP-binding protein, partial [Chloroflexi bacterium]|nr:ATP-binding protein [Chloroflexota bacterium]
MVTTDAESPWGADEREITRSIVRDCIWLVTGVSFLILAVGGLREEAITYAIFGFFAALAFVALLAYWVNRTHTELSALLLSVGSMVVLIAGIRVFPEVLLAPWLLVCVLLICSALGWQAGVASGVTGTVLLAVDVVQHAAPPLTPFNAASIAAAMWCCVALYWLISRPTRAALGWAMNSYQKALQETERARERQAELVRLSKTLSESNYRLQQLNLELERARQQAQEASRLKTQFATAVSHELRTPLNLIIGFCEMMVLAPESAYGEVLPPNYQRDLEVVYRNAYHISALVDDILDLSQIEADRMALQRDWHSISVVVKEAVRVVESLFRTRNLWLRVELPPDLPAVFVDKTRIRQILINLLSNAARLTDQGGATVRVEKASDRLLIHIEDTGPGIPYDDIQRIFEEFQQSRLSGGRRGGTGLGLTVSKRFAELHGGTLGVQSVLGQGTTLTLALPLTKEAAHDERGGYFGRADRAPGRRSEPAVLVFDPSKYLHRVFQRYLDGYRVLYASTAASMRQQLKRRPVQAIPY